jgi:hypothetical protein
MPTWLPGADLSQRADLQYPGVITRVTKGVLHSTETGTWPGYGGGKSAPNLTALWHGGRLHVRQHFPLEMSSRALKNLTGGVLTNADEVVQIELIGSCDRAFARRYGYLYIPEAPDEWYDAVAALMRQIEAATDIPRVATTRPWLPYPRSYGDSPARMTHSEWDRFRGWCGHQHAAENDHGDPGDIDIARLIGTDRQQQEDDLTPDQDAKLNGTFENSGEARRLSGEALEVAKQALAQATAANENAAETRRLAAVILGVQPGLGAEQAPGQVDVGALTARLSEGLGQKVAAELGAALVAAGRVEG